MSTIRLFLDFADLPHAGIILSLQFRKGELIRRTLRLLGSLSAEEIAGTVCHLAGYK
jgi:hypothetical protein